MTIILQFALMSNLYFISQLLYRRYSGNFLVNLLGKWKESEYSGGQFFPVNGHVQEDRRWGAAREEESWGSTWETTQEIKKSKRRKPSSSNF
ncbi:hypothetical protein ACFX15_029121 [Malus domestica]